MGDAYRTVGLCRCDARVPLWCGAVGRLLSIAVHHVQFIQQCKRLLRRVLRIACKISLSKLRAVLPSQQRPGASPAHTASEFPATVSL
jgi:hypothetical protein